MPDGKVHSAGTNGVALAMVIGELLASTHINSGIIDYAATIAGVLSGHVMSPDLDVDAGYVGFAYVRKLPLFGWLISLLLQLYWKPYAIAIPHRGFLSHTPVISTVFRLIYVSPLAIATIYYVQLVLFYYLGFSTWDFYMNHQAQIWAFFLRFVLGLMLADTNHFLLDWAHGHDGKNDEV